MVESDRPQTAIQRMRFASWVTKATDSHSEYVILLAFARQEGLRERASILHLYTNCRSFYDLNTELS
jgi:hypothetical protein